MVALRIVAVNRFTAPAESDCKCLVTFRQVILCDAESELGPIRSGFRFRAPYSLGIWVLDLVLVRCTTVYIPLESKNGIVLVVCDGVPN